MGMYGGGGGGIPEMTEDEKEFNALNLANAQRMSELQEQMTPLVLADMGYEWEDYEVPGSSQGEYAPQEYEMSDEVANHPWRTMGGTSNRAWQQQVVLPEQQQWDANEATRRAEWDANLPTQDRRLVEIEDPGREQRDLLKQQGLDIQQSANARVLAAQKGELDIDPSVEADIERGSSQLRTELFKKLGPGAEGSDAWNRSIAEFERESNALRYSIRHGEMTTADAIASNRESASRRGEQQKYGQQQGVINPFAVSANVLGSGAKSYQDERFFSADLSQRRSDAKTALIGSAISGGAAAAGSIYGARRPPAGG